MAYRRSLRILREYFLRGGVAMMDDFHGAFNARPSSRQQDRLDDTLWSAYNWDLSDGTSKVLGAIISL